MAGLMALVFGSRSELHRDLFWQSWNDDHEGVKRTVMEIEKRGTLNGLAINSYAWACIHTGDASSGLEFLSRNRERFDVSQARVFEGTFRVLLGDDSGALELLLPSPAKFFQRRRSGSFEGQRCYMLAIIYCRMSRFAEAMSWFCHALGHSSDDTRVSKGMIDILRIADSSDRAKLIQVMEDFRDSRHRSWFVSRSDDVSKRMEEVLIVATRLAR